MRRGPVSTACTAQAGRGSAAQGAGCVWEFHLLSMRLAVPLSIRMPLSTKLLNASLTTAGTRILIKSFLGGTAVCPLLPIETSGALEIQICSHHAKMQWLWHCLSSTESWKSSIHPLGLRLHLHCWSAVSSIPLRKCSAWIANCATTLAAYKPPS